MTKVADDWPAAMVTLVATEISLVSGLVIDTVSGAELSVLLRVTVAVAVSLGSAIELLSIDNVSISKSVTVNDCARSCNTEGWWR